MEEKTNTDRTQHNICLLDRPMFVTSRKLAQLESYSDGNGYTMTTIGGLPELLDKKILYCVLSKAQRLATLNLHYTSVHSLIKEIGMAHNKQNYERIRESLLKWRNTNFHFDNGTFREKKLSFTIRSERSFGVLQDMSITDEGVYIHFTEAFFNANMEKFSRSIHVETVMQLSNPLALRLYEILVKLYNEEWSIGLKKLFRKMAAQIDKPSRMLAQLDKALNEVNKVEGRMADVSYKVRKSEDENSDEDYVLIFNFKK